MWLTTVRTMRTSLALHRNTAAATQATDPIQQLFLDKIREYQKQSVGGKLVDPSPEIVKELKTEMEKLEKQYGAGAGVDMTKFPAISFQEPKLDSINLEEATKK